MHSVKSATVTSHELDSADRTANRHSFKVMVTRSMKRTCDKRCFRRAVQILFLSAITVVSCARGTSFRPARLDFFGKRTRTAVEVARTRPIVACWVLRTNTPDGLARSYAIRRGWGKSCDYLEFIDDATPGIQVDWVEKYEDYRRRVTELGNLCTTSTSTFHKQTLRWLTSS